MTNLYSASPTAGRAKRLDADAYRTIAETVSYLCRSDADLLSEREIAIAFDILTMILGRLEARGRRMISERVARRADLPRGLALPLARDEIYVAVPLLLHCPALSDEDQLEIAAALAPHRLALAERPGLGLAVTRALIEIGDTPVIQCLIDNASAAFDHDCFRALTERARDEIAIQEPLVERRDFPPDLAGAMLPWVGAGMKRVIARRFGAAIAEAVRPDIDRALEGVLARLPAAAAATGYARFARVFAATEREIAILTRLDADAVRRALTDGGPKAFTLMCRASGVTRGYFETLYRDFHGLADIEAMRNAPEYMALTALFDRGSPEQAKEHLIQAITEARRAAGSARLTP